jgi:hypothetical protein
MFAFIDESGNTGPNLFDAAQPGFYSAAVMSKRDIDPEFSCRFARLAAGAGVPSLHAAQMGASALDAVLPDIQAMIASEEIRFFLGVINKRDLVLIKLADTLLDNFENRAVPWHVYNVRKMRLLTVLKLSAVADEASLKKFWATLMQHNAARAQSEFSACLEGLDARVHLLPDARSREIIGNAIRWALEHPGALTVHAQRSARLGHLPHLVVFPSVLHAIQKQSEAWNLPVTEIRHDRESLVATALENWHELISQAPVTTLKWVDMEYPVGAAPGSQFKIVSSKTSAGVQLADIILWLVRRASETGNLSEAGEAFLDQVLHESHPFELSLNAINASLEMELAPIMSMPMSEAQLDEGRKLLAEIESRRRDALADYERDK